MRDGFYFYFTTSGCEFDGVVEELLYDPGYFFVVGNDLGQEGYLTFEPDIFGMGFGFGVGNGRGLSRLGGSGNLASITRPTLHCSRWLNFANIG